MAASSPSKPPAPGAKGGASRKRTPSVAAGAARAAGERARRRATPLLPPASDPADVDVPGSEPAPETPDSGTTALTPPGHDRPEPGSSAGAARTPAAPEQRRESTAARAKAAPSPRPHLRVVRDEPLEPGSDREHPPLPLLSELAENVADSARSLAQRLGITDAEAEAKIAGGLAFLRRRLTGEYTVDDFGFDADFAEHVIYPLLRPLFQKWFRVEVRGIEHIPATGGALVVGNHSGTVAVDSLMTELAIFDTHPAGRHLRELGADLIFATPFLGDIARKGGATLATNADAERLLADGHLVGVWPEGFKGIGKPFSERYKLQRFGRGGFVATALKTGVPIIPCSIVGAEEIYPIIANAKPIARALHLPYFPLTATFPWLGPLGLVPLPSKWIIEFGPPIDTAALGPEAAEDPVLVFDLTDRVRETIQQTLYALLLRRGSVFS